MYSINADNRKYDKPEAKILTKDITEGRAVACYNDRDHCWMEVGGRKIHNRDDAVKYAVKMNNFISRLEGLA